MTFTGCVRFARECGIRTAADRSRGPARAGDRRRRSGWAWRRGSPNAGSGGPPSRPASPSRRCLQHIVSLSPVGIVVVDTYRDVVYTNDRARELGLVRDRLLDDRAWVAAQRTLATGEDVEVDLSPRRRANPRPLRAVGARPRPAADRGRPPVRRRLRRRPVRARADGGHAPRLRRQRQPRTQDAGRGDGRARRGAAGLHRRPRDRAPVRREDGHRVQAAGQHGRRADRAVAAAGRRAAARPRGRRRRHRRGRGAVAIQGGRRQRRHRDHHRRADRLRVLGDQPLLVTAMANLVSNAIAYSPNGSPVSISRRRRGDNIEIAVTDRGIGIAARRSGAGVRAVLPRRQGRSRATGGTGLGLAIVKHVAANHNGSIRLWSQPGTGSTFTLSIPAYPDQETIRTTGRTERERITERP